MEKTEIITQNAPKPFGIFSQGIKAGKFLFISGQVAKDAVGQVIGKGDIKAQTRQCLENLKAVLQGGGATLEDVVKVTVFVADIRHLNAIHEVRAEYFQKPYPASTLVEISHFTDPHYLVEIEATAMI
jgi:2-iminobutanoate/2-iminopropanoate deaminase